MQATIRLRSRPEARALTSAPAPGVSRMERAAGILSDNASQNLHLVHIEVDFNIDAASSVCMVVRRPCIHPHCPAPAPIGFCVRPL